MHALKRLKSANRFINLYSSAANSRRLLPPPAAAAKIGRIKRRKKVRQPLKNVVRLTCESAAEGGVCDVYVIGSVHDCPRSWAEVKAVIQFVKPEAVFLELCTSRRHILTPDKKIPTLQDMVHMWKKNESIYSILFKRTTAKRFREYNNVVTAGDFRAAYNEATKYGAKVILGDRPIEITHLRHWANTSIWPIFLLYTIGTNVFLPEDLSKKAAEAQKTGKLDADLVKQLICEATKQDPIGSKIIIDERDQYMSFTLLEAARQHKSVVAVVGMAHVPGIQNYWKQHVEVEQLLNVPLRKKMLRIATRVAQVACLYGTYLYFDELRQGWIQFVEALPKFPKDRVD
ncbi:traB domain-containing protein-like [Salvia hispanica]|uniref:traB domain-containing protein-like n=1 Tax=Salvia hispanica TaxID=49212 RepID=UPI002009A99D|nr:traB domain-containing protein-like [Salvia hispanica]